MAGTACAGVQLPGLAPASAPREFSTPRRVFGRPKWLDGSGEATADLSRDLGPFERVRRPPGLGSRGPASATLSELPDVKSLAAEAPAKRGLTGRLVGDSFTSPELPKMGRATTKESGADEVFLPPPDPYGFARTCFLARPGQRASFSQPSGLRCKRSLPLADPRVQARAT
ncbi:unnamed protein product [Prorocentrum cordatum]|uniref:Uncharacterized protein n=1 Tax=Prorocentrum cordatum TaxID=2364126 RepID=A0ABN9XAU4_9DINO|nr:unnamed protein product [Polarella glacialis]